MPRATRVLVIDAPSLDTPTYLPGEFGYEVESVSTGQAGIDRFGRVAFDVVLTELRLPDMSGFEILERLLAIDAAARVIFVTDHGSVRLAVDAVKAGAFHVVQKPFEPEHLRLLVERARAFHELGVGARRLRGETLTGDRYGAIIGRSKAMQNVFALIDAVAESDANILIVGESGTGKELVADAIHARSPRASRAFVKINCSALPGELVENELFGHAPGAFTGAVDSKQGLVGSALGGSLMLDEICEMPLAIQAKLLRVIQERRYTRLGSRKSVKADFRLIAATNRSPEDAIRAGRLREDLYYRISTITILVPPLRDRGKDVELLATHMLERFSAKYEKRIAGFSPEAHAAILDYAWPGNVRELENSIERAVLLTHGPTVAAEVLTHLAKHDTPHVEAEMASTTAEPCASLVVASSDAGPVVRETTGLAVPLGMSLPGSSGTWRAHEYKRCNHANPDDVSPTRPR
jgi:DNA-binding NtrC family response regulator